jgi:hypothetical protein
MKKNFYLPSWEMECFSTVGSYIESRSTCNACIWITQTDAENVFRQGKSRFKSYEGLVEKYHQKLKAGGKASGRFLPRVLRFDQRKIQEEKLMRNIERLAGRIDRYDEASLDLYIPPHPLLGKLTLKGNALFHDLSCAASSCTYA